MLPTLIGRIQTRIAGLAVIGGLVTLVVTPLTAGPGGFATTFSVLAAMIVLGLGWEFVYHLIQQFRWEKDWPTPFALLTGINEGLLGWFAVSAGVVPNSTGLTGAQFLVHFGAVWIVVWLWNSGPIRVPLVRWRFLGGRLI